MNQNELKKCRACAELISVEARLCKECGIYQDWRASVAISNTTFALIVAFISVVGSVYPVISTAIKQEDSKLVASIQSIINNQVIGLISNLGTRPGSVDYAKIWIASDNEDHGQAFIELNLVPQSTAQYVVSPSSSIGLLLSPPKNGAELISENFTTDELPPRICIVFVGLVEFSGDRHKVSENISCRKLFIGLWGGEGVRISNKYLLPEA